MQFIYPLELKLNDQISVQLDDGNPPHYEPVKNVYRQGDKAVVETDRRMLRLDPGLKVQALADRPGGSPAPRPFNSNEWP